MNEMNELDSSDFKDKSIQINPEVTPKTSIQSNSQQNNNNNKQQEPKGIIGQGEQKLGESLIQSATEQLTKSWIEKYLCCLDFLKVFFDISSVDFYRRFLFSLIPFNTKFQDLINKTPDAYGPFWIYSTLILVVASSGSLTLYIQGNSTTNFFQTFVPIATGIIYGVGFGLPLLLYLLMKCFGSQPSFMAVLCTYGYSLSIFIPISIICVCPYQIVQWIVLGYGIVSSTSILIVSYWKELGKYVDKKRYIIISIVLVVQVGLYLLFKLYFFHKFTEEVHT